MFAITDVNKEMLQKADSQLPIKHSQLVKNDELGHGWTSPSLWPESKPPQAHSEGHHRVSVYFICIVLHL